MVTLYLKNCKGFRYIKGSLYNIKVRLVGCTNKGPLHITERVNLDWVTPLNIILNKLS